MERDKNNYNKGFKTIYEQDDEEPQKLIENNIESLKAFRKFGIVNSNTSNNVNNKTKSESLDDKVVSLYEMEKEKSIKLEEDKKFRNELEKRR